MQFPCFDALSYAHLCEGKIDIVIQCLNKIWDIHPIIPIVKASGGNISTWKNEDAVKAKFGGSSAGHNGIESIDKFIGKDYSRVRIGIGKPNGKGDAADHVLKDFDEDEKLKLGNITMHITNSLPILLVKKLDLFSSTVNNK